MSSKEGVVGTYVYRCDNCREESDPLTRRELDYVRNDHRHQFHGGLKPDGEQVLQPERMRLADLPREQRIVGGILLAVILLSFLAKVT